MLLMKIIRKKAATGLKPIAASEILRFAIILFKINRNRHNLQIAATDKVDNLVAVLAFLHIGLNAFQRIEY